MVAFMMLFVVVSLATVVDRVRRLYFFFNFYSFTIHDEKKIMDLIILLDIMM